MKMQKKSRKTAQKQVNINANGVCMLLGKQAEGQQCIRNINKRTSDAGKCIEIAQQQPHRLTHYADLEYMP